jgi:deazaflavin-dependent oxidoreductase (nitroreductase family)
MDEIVDSPSTWVAEHIRNYVRTGGAEGSRLFDNDVLLITTRGRITGKLRRTPVMYGCDGDNYIVVASYRGMPSHPCWYLNLVANPEVILQVGPHIFAAKARTVTEDEREPRWAMMASRFPTFVTYQEQTTRRFPVISLEPAIVRRTG